MRAILIALLVCPPAWAGPIKQSSSPSSVSAGSVDTTKLSAGAVDTNRLNTDAVTTDKILDGAVTAGKLASGALDTTKLAAGAVDTNRLNTDAVTTTKILDGAVTGRKVASALFVSSTTLIPAATGTNGTFSAAIASVTVSGMTKTRVECLVLERCYINSLVNGISTVIELNGAFPGIYTSSAGMIQVFDPVSNNNANCSFSYVFEGLSGTSNSFALAHFSGGGSTWGAADGQMTCKEF